MARGVEAPTDAGDGTTAARWDARRRPQAASHDKLGASVACSQVMARSAPLASVASTWRTQGSPVDGRTTGSVIADCPETVRPADGIGPVGRYAYERGFSFAGR
jgi:hypothetical protein